MFLSERKWLAGTLAVVLMTMLLMGCGGASSGSPSPTPSVNKITVAPGTAMVPLGSTQQLSATATLSDGSSQNVTSYVLWTVTPPNVAKVSSSGLLTSLAEGTASVSARISSTSGESSVTIGAPGITSIQLSPDPPAIPAGTMQQMTATATYTDGTTGNVTNLVTWSANPSTVVTMTSGGLARGVSKGSFSITASTSSTSESVMGSVGNPIVQSLQINPSAASIPNGTMQSFTASAVYSDGSTQDVSASTSWQSSDTTVATVNSNGVASAVSQGSTQISAAYQTFNSAASLTVTAASVRSIAVSPATASIAKGTTQQMTANATMSNGGTQNLTNSVTWSASPTSVCTVNSSGMASAVGLGNCTVTATSGSVNGTASLTITAATLASITITPSNPSVNSGGSLQLTATGTFSDGSTQNLTSSLTYVSSKPLVANVNAQGVLQGLAPGTATITASLGSVKTTFNVTITTATLQGISILPSPVTIAAGISVQLSATGSYSDGSTQDLSSTVTWTSSAPTVAAVSASGQLTGIVAGDATITASFGAVLGIIVPGIGVSGSTQVTVTPASIVSITVNPLSVTIAAGQTQAFTASASMSDGTTMDVTSSASWSVGNPLLAQISNNFGSAGVLTSLAPGSTTVSASIGSVTGTANLYVSAASLVSVQVSPSTLTLALGVPAHLTATGSFSDGSTQDITLTAQWTSSNGRVVSVAEGLVTPIAVGNATVTASMNGLSGSAAVTVTAATLSSITVSTPPASLALGLSAQLTAMGNYGDGSTQNITAGVHWTSSNTAVATVSVNGLVLAVGAGNTTIMASSGLVSGSVSVVVSPAILQSISVTALQSLVALGFTLPLTATGTYSDGSTQNLTSSVTWSASNTGIALISSLGVVSGLTVGPITATATLQGVSGDLAVTVTPATLASITISPAAVTLATLLSTQQFTVTGQFSDGSTQVLTAGVHWSSSKGLLGSINADGLLSALGLGNLNVVATYDGFTATAAVSIL